MTDFQNSTMAKLKKLHDDCRDGKITADQAIHEAFCVGIDAGGDIAASVRAVPKAEVAACAG